MKNKIALLIYMMMLLPVALLGRETGNQDCTSYFTWDPVSGADATIKFTNLSTGEFNTWMWDFGDGLTSGVFHPTHTFDGFGIYYVCLTITDGQNCYDVFCDSVEVIPQCQAEFNITYVPTSPPLVQFTDVSTGYPDTWHWTFGDGATSSQQNPVHSYNEPGTYEVCLVIGHTDSLYSCSDSVCKEIIIPDSLNCEADFIYEIAEDSPFKVHFTDQSAGNITDWEWDFGDGHTSNEQNPVHIFNQQGQYLVCLKVENDDSLEYCLHFICETIILTDSVQCQAGFTAQADSNSTVMYKYHFTDKSIGNPNSWHWDFGDGAISNDQHPMHIYAEPGTYEVCLKAWNSINPGCNDQHCMLIKTPNYFQLGGLAFIGNNPLNNPYPTGDTGIAILYRQKADYGFVAVDTNIFHELGYYWFDNMMELGYMIRISLSRGSAHYHDYIPSYSPGVISWQQAGVFMLNDDLFEMNTSLTEILGTESGPGRISGRVVSGRNFSVDMHSSFRNVPVILTDQSNTPLAWTATDEYGQFWFNGMAMGTYLLHADVAGIWSQTELVIISEDSPAVDTVTILMYENSPFGIEETTDDIINLNSLFPNPVINSITLDLWSDKPMPVRINIINITGQDIFSQEQHLRDGSNKMHIPTGDLPSGIYMLSINWQGQKHGLTKKFIKK